jgi:hypothetical protein
VGPFRRDRAKPRPLMIGPATKVGNLKSAILEAEPCPRGLRLPSVAHVSASACRFSGRQRFFTAHSPAIPVFFTPRS